MITGYPSSPKVSQFNLAPFPLKQHISSIALPRWDGSTNLPVPRLATSRTLKSCKDLWSNILSLQLRGPPPNLMNLPQPLPSHSLPGTPPWILMLSLHCTPSVILGLLPHPSLCSKQTRPLFLTLTWSYVANNEISTWHLLIISKWPTLKVQIRCHLLPNVFLHSARTDCASKLPPLLSLTPTVSYTCISYWCLGNFLLLGEGWFLLISTPSVCCRAYLINNCPECLINEGMSSGRREWLGFSST